MQSRFKLFLPLGILVAGTSSSTLLTSTHSLRWTSLIGGGFSFLKNLIDTESNVQHLALEKETVQKVKGQDYSKTKITNLEVIEENLIGSEAFQEKLEIEESRKNIPSIYKEVTKEAKTITIDGKSKNKISEISKKLNKRERQSFKQALEKIRKFKSGADSFSPRSRVSRSVSSSIQKLSIDEKKSISSFFERFAELDKNKHNFSNELSQAAGDGVSSKQTSGNCLSCIPKDLKTIGWNNSELNIFDKKPSYTYNPIYPLAYYQNHRALDKTKAKSTWGTWSSRTNPYRELFSSEDEWLSSVNAISEAWKKYYGYMNSGSRIATSFFSLGMAGSSEKPTLEKKISEAKDSFELKIGSRLMSFMNQLS